LSYRRRGSHQWADWRDLAQSLFDAFCRHLTVDGTKFGLARKVGFGQHIATARRTKADGHTTKDIAKFLGVSRTTLYRYLAEAEAA